MPRTEASSFSHFVLLWPRKWMCFPACLWEHERRASQRTARLPLQTLAPPAPRYAPAASSPSDPLEVLNRSQLDVDSFRRRLSIHCCDSTWVNTLKSWPGLPASRQVTSDFNELRTQPKLEQKNHPAEKVSCWEELPFLGALKPELHNCFSEDPPGQIIQLG